MLYCSTRYILHKRILLSLETKYVKMTDATYPFIMLVLWYVTSNLKHAQCWRYINSPRFRKGSICCYRLCRPWNSRWWVMLCCVEFVFDWIWGFLELHCLCICYKRTEISRCWCDVPQKVNEVFPNRYRWMRKNLHWREIKLSCIFKQLLVLIELIIKLWHW